jgi:O-antigen/teichoic acid export membrane protein
MLERRKFIGDWITNMISLAALALSGLLINALIVKFYGVPVLGVFNQVLAIYILGSQIATCGVQFSVLTAIAQHADDCLRCREILGSALILCAGASLIVATTLALSADFLGRVIFSPGVAIGTLAMAPGLWFLSINKVLLNALNGFQDNKTYALLTTLRYVLMSLSFVAAIAIGVEGNKLGGILSVTEAVLLLVIVATCRTRLGRPKVSGAWIRKHFHFGGRSILGGVAVELNTRIDVLVLGLFTTDADVGVYSFAAFFVEGVLHLPALSRRIVDPVLARLVAAGQKSELRALMVRGRNMAALLLGTTAAIAVAAYPVYARLLSTPTMAASSWPIFAILMSGGFVYSVYATFAGLFVQAGLPALQSSLNLMIVATNLALNLMLVPLAGTSGAAVATALSFILGTLYFRSLVGRYIGFSV